MTVPEMSARAGVDREGAATRWIAAGAALKEPQFEFPAARRRALPRGTDAGVLTERLFHTAFDACAFNDLLASPHVLTEPEAAALAALQAAMDAI